MLLSAALCILWTGSSSIARGDDWYGQPATTSYTNHYRDIVTGDIDRDGITDAVLKGYPRYYVYFGRADGQMVRGDSLGGDTGDRMHALVDEDHDGWLDLIYYLDWQFHIMRNDRAGHFVATGRMFPGLPPITVGDLDADGFEDVLVTDGSYGIEIHYGSADGVALGYTYLAFDDEISGLGLLLFNDLRVVDLNKDGRPDVMATGCYQDEYFVQWSRIWWRLGEGNHSFGPERFYSSGIASSEYGTIDIADINGDGANEVACTHTGSPWSIHIFRYDNSLDQLEVLGTGLPHGEPQFALFDDDSIPDLLTGRWFYDDGRVYRGLGDGSFELVQELRGARVCALGTVITSSAKDILAASYGTDGRPTITVWPWQGSPMEAQEPATECPGDLRIAPRVTSDALGFVRTGSLADEMSADVIDVNGRVVRSLRLVGMRTTWDLRSSTGGKVPAGVYWVRITTPAASLRGGRVCVVR
jgi:hypothetical protein